MFDRQRFGFQKTEWWMGPTSITLFDFPSISSNINALWLNSSSFSLIVFYILVSFSLIKIYFICLSLKKIQEHPQIKIRNTLNKKIYLFYFQAKKIKKELKSEKKKKNRNRANAKPMDSPKKKQPMASPPQAQQMVENSVTHGFT